MSARAILFDLDGTLVDTREASWRLFAETNLAFALGIDSRDDFFRTFEGNFFDSLARICPDPARAAAVKAHFMELLRTRYHPSLIPGMVDVVRALAPSCTLAVVSTNGMEAIRRILVGGGIATCFSHVFSGDVEPRKAVSMRRFLGDRRYAAHRTCSPAYQDSAADGAQLDGGDVVLVTDTVGDIAEAREAGVRAVGVAWGMHSEQKLLEAGAEKVALWPQELVAWLRPGPASPVATACACSLPGAAPVAAGARATQAGAAAVPSTGPAGTAVADPAPALREAGRIRTERRLEARGAAQRLPLKPAPASENWPADAVAPAELLSAVRTILGGDPPVDRSRPP